ncbi:MAG: thioredoxin domain-containing protein [Deltaproteobacteria bacterium]|nr:thioredoxin domain-containing protein [Deltaproteobacteria bacterium]
MANKLISEKSPYLLQHAQNPVDWYPWGAAAFNRAHKENKPIFLSIGYSTCHWCHVMEKESFEDPEVARLLNETFICIKVDREERPDIDNTYMTVCQMMIGSGGWPLTIIMTPDKKPFFATTYIPKETRFGRIGMKEIVPSIKVLWEERRNELLTSAEQIAGALDQIEREAREPLGSELGEGTLKTAYDQLARSFDAQNGGFGTAPKFPTPHNLMFLLRYWRRTGDKRALGMVEKTLEAMRLGGIYDHVGFGFHRYATDSRWFLPHFEKMLYDQALLAMAHIEAYQATDGNGAYEQTAREIFSYVLRDMMHPEGGFYSAEDADSEGEEGRFYLWTLDEVERVLSQEEAALIARVFNVKEKGNFQEEATGGETGKNILFLENPLAAIASDLAIPLEVLIQRLGTARVRLLEARAKRVRPHKDDKILTDWNGLMIAALAKGDQVFDEPRYAEAARQSADFILTRLVDARGRLYHRYRDGEAAIEAFLDDYAFLCWGLIELYEATFETSYLQKALDLNAMMLKYFWDRERGGFYFTADDADRVLVRKKEIYDGAVPSGNAVAMLNLQRLARLTGHQEYVEKAAALARTFSDAVMQSPGAHTQLLIALDLARGPSYEVVIVGDPQAEDTKAMVGALRKAFVPNKVVIFRPPNEEAPTITRLAGFTKDLGSLDGKATAYVCRAFRCELPTTDVHRMLALLKDER